MVGNKNQSLNTPLCCCCALP